MKPDIRGRDDDDEFQTGVQHYVRGRDDDDEFLVCWARLEVALCLPPVIPARFDHLREVLRCHLTEWLLLAFLNVQLEVAFSLGIEPLCSKLGTLSRLSISRRVVLVLFCCACGLLLGLQVAWRVRSQACVVANGPVIQGYFVDSLGRLAVFAMVLARVSLLLFLRSLLGGRGGLLQVHICV